MASNFESFAGPSYISSRSADVILSDVRPIKLKLEALRSMNVLLDEFLYNILNAANSLSTDKLKTGLNKVLPSTLGKDAVLEAEMELKAYWERNTPHTPSTQGFDLQWSFELLRLKCEAYSTMNDTDEDAEVERRLNERMINSGGTEPPHPSLMAPAALYLTAILEHVCQHVLSNVSRVAARDSSRTLATVNDLFVALCEDPLVYATFKAMKVYEQIEALSKAPKRTRSMSKSSKSIDRSFSSPQPISPSPDLLRRDAASPQGHRQRISSDSVGPGAAAAAVFSQLSSSRGSYDKSRIKIFGRSSSDHDRSETPRSFDEDSKRSGSFDLVDEAALQEFDELMRSSTTMKVSLTPDRLKSMEVYKQEKRRAKAAGQEVENDPFLAVAGSEVKRAVSARRAHARVVDAITEDDEPSPIKAQPLSPSQTVVVPRTRQTSLSGAGPSPPAAARSRSVTISNPQVLAKKRSVGQIKPGVPPIPPSILVPQRDNMVSNGSPMQYGRPPRTRKIARNRESLDLDDVMGGDDDEIMPMSPPKTPKTPGKPYISKTARDLIDFLDEGPPQELEPPNMNASMISLESSRSRSGRLQRMISKLSLGGSNEKLNGRSSTVSDPRRSPSMNSVPPSSYLPSSLSSRTGRAMPAVVVATPPPPQGSFSTPAASFTPPASYSPTPPPVSPSASYSVNGGSPVEPPASLGGILQNEVFDNPRLAGGRRISVVRKAVPSWEPSQSKDEDECPPPIQTVIAPPLEKPRRKSSSPLDEFPPVPTSAIPNSRARGDTLSGKSEVSIGAVLWAEASSTSSPLTSPNGTAPPSPSASLRRPHKKTSLRSTTSSPRPPANDAPHALPDEPLHQPSPPPEPEVQAQASPVPSTVANSVMEVDSADISEKPEPVVVGPTSGLTFDDAQDLRRLLSVATTADECRLLVDMFFVKSGYPVLTQVDDDIIPVAAPQKLTSCPVDEASKIATSNADMERSLIMHYLGGFDDLLEESAAETPAETESLEPASST